MRFKHFLYLASLVCGMAAIIMSLYSMHWADMVRHIEYANHGPVENELILMKALNYVLPTGVICIGLLLWTWKIDSVGVVPLLILVLCQLMAADVSFRAVKKVYGQKATLASVTWWAPADKAVPGGKPVRHVGDS